MIWVYAFTGRIHHQLIGWVRKTCIHARIRPSRSLIIIIPSLIWMCEGGGYGISPSSYRGWTLLPPLASESWGLRPVSCKARPVGSGYPRPRGIEASVDLSDASGLTIEELISGSDCRLPHHPYFHLISFSCHSCRATQTKNGLVNSFRLISK